MASPEEVDAVVAHLRRWFPDAEVTLSTDEQTGRACFHVTERGLPYDSVLFIEQQVFDFLRNAHLAVADYLDNVGIGRFMLRGGPQSTAIWESVQRGPMVQRLPDTPPLADHELLFRLQKADELLYIELRDYGDPAQDVRVYVLRNGFLSSEERFGSRERAVQWAQGHRDALVRNRWLLLPNVD